MLSTGTKTAGFDQSLLYLLSKNQMRLEVKNAPNLALFGRNELKSLRL